MAALRYNKEKMVKLAEYYIENYDEWGDTIPSIAGLAEILGMHRNTIYDWERQYPEWVTVMEKVRAAQERALLNNGLNNTFNPTITKLILQQHGYSDKSELNVGGQRDNPVKVDATLSPSDAYLKMLGK